MSACGVALVTGGTGFIGSHLVAVLLANGWTVRCVVRPTSNLRWLDGQSIQPVTGDLTSPDSAALRKALEGVSVVFHLAGTTSSAGDEGYSRVNVGSTRHVLEAMAAAAPDALLVLCSSLSAAGPVNGRHTINETVTPRPVSIYGQSKLKAEMLVEKSGLRYAVVRPPPVYGPRDSGIFSLFRLVSLGIAPHVTTPDQRLSIVHVSDLVRGMMRIAEVDARGIFYMTDGVPHTWHEIMSEIATAVGRTPKFLAVSPRVADALARIERFRGLVMGDKPKLTPDRLIELSQNDWTCSDLWARLELDYESSVALAPGMLSTAKWYRTAGWLPR
ncbi:MAG: NAD(P)-dependent oxidoreductase [Gemmatimonadaceae bacterium]